MTTLPERVYHFTSLETFMNYILPTKQLKLSKIKSSRDPYEYEPLRFRCFSDDPLGNDKNFTKFLKTVAELKLNSQYLCFTAPENHKTENGNYFNRWGYDRPQLWEHYGNKHHGVCISLDTKKVINSFMQKENCSKKGEFTHNNVHYKDIVSRSDSLKEMSLKEYYTEFKVFRRDNFLKTFEQPLFFQKDKGYENEAEYRLLFITNIEQEDVKFSIKDAVHGIYFGSLVEEKFVEFYRPVIMKTFSRIEYEKIKWFNGSVVTTKYEDD